MAAMCGHSHIIPKGGYMSLWNAFETNEKKEVDGVPIQPAPANEDGTMPTFIIARIGGQNHQFTKIRERIFRPYLREIEAGTISPRKQHELNVDVFCEANLRGWSHVYDRSGQPINYSPRAAKEILTALPDLYQELAYQASRVQNYQSMQTEAAEKN